MTHAQPAAQKMTDTVDPRPVLRITRTFDASRERVYAAFTKPEELEKWFGPQSVKAVIHQLDARPGGAYSLTMTHPDGEEFPLSGVYREVIPGEKLVYTWIWGEGEFAGVETLVTLVFKDLGGKTELTLTHEMLPSSLAREKHQEGWSGSFDCLEAEVEQNA